MHDVDRRADLERTAQGLFDATADGILDADIRDTCTLSDAVAAHHAFEAGGTVGAGGLQPRAARAKKRKRR